MVKGLISVEELIEESLCEYEKNLILAIRDSVTCKYRKENLEQRTVLSFTNFPKVMKIFSKQ